jgi:predicted nucleotidyltransferase
MLNTPLMREIDRSGFSSPEAIIHLFVGGSALHGVKVAATDDLDIYGVFLPGPEEVLGLSPRAHFVWSTASDERRNTQDDVDVTLYSLRRWAELGARGNATALHFLFSDATETSSPLWDAVEAERALFLSRQCAKEFLGFANNQMQRITGEKGRGAKGRRPEYESAYGYDTKAAMHCMRLYFECIELMESGFISLPRPELDVLKAVRLGEWTLERLLEEAQMLRERAVKAAEISYLPDEVDREAISRLLAKIHLAAWS